MKPQNAFQQFFDTKIRRAVSTPKTLITDIFQVVWTRQGLQMQGSDKHQMMYDEASGKVSLLIKAIGPGDEGEYTCTALNPYGEAICTVYISPEATNKQVRKSKSGHKLHKSKSGHDQQMLQQQQIVQQQAAEQQQQQVQPFSQQQQQQSMQKSFQQSFQQSSSSMSTSQQSFQQQSAASFQQQSASSFQQQSAASFQQESSASSSFQQSSSMQQQSSSSFQQSSSMQQSSVQQFSSSQQSAISSSSNQMSIMWVACVTHFIQATFSFQDKHLKRIFIHFLFMLL